MSNGKLYVIGTPIGNLGDISLRAIETLNRIEILVCEDSRVTSRLINSLTSSGLVNNKPRYFAYNEFNEDRIWEEVVSWVVEGKIVGLVSDAGMPMLSDPGYKLIRGIIDAKLDLEVIPGPTALTTALPYGAIGGEVVLYLGFLPKTRGKAEKMLKASYELLTQIQSGRIVLYVSPHRVQKDLLLIKEVMGDVTAVLLRELTKKFEERIEGTISELLKQYTIKPFKGELVLIVSQETTASHTGRLVDPHNFEDGGSDVTQNSTAKTALGVNPVGAGKD